MGISAKLGAFFLVFLIFAIILPNQSSAADDNQFVCGNHFKHHEIIVEPPPGGWELRQDEDVREPRLSSIVLNAGATLAGNADALAAFNRAIDTWISWFDDPITVYIDADLVPMASDVIGEATLDILLNDYDLTRDQMVSDAAMDETICNYLPNSSDFGMFVITAAGCPFNNNMGLTLPNMKALGYNLGSMTGISIEFNSNKLSDFDFDRTNGIDEDMFDFEGMVLHEIGHALGFNSRVNTTDDWLYQGYFVETRPRPLDLFRLEPGAGAIDFLSAARIQVPANHPPDPIIPVQMTYDGFNDLSMSTGLYFGDGRQADHWKDDNISGEYLGLMDPTINRGQQVKPMKNDIRALGLCGWDVGQGPCDGLSYGDCNNDGIPLSVADLVYLENYLVGDVSHYNNLCSYELNHYDNPFFPCEPTFGDLLFYSKYYLGSFTIGDLNSECKYTEFPESYDLNIVMPENVDLSSSFSDVLTIQLENNNDFPVYVHALTVPVRFPYTGGTGTDTYTFTNIQDYGIWDVINPINPSGTPAVQFITYGSPVMVPALSTIDLFDVDYNWVHTSGAPVMTAELFAEVPGCFPVASVSTTPKGSESRQPHWLMEVTLGSKLMPYDCDCVPGEADLTPPVNILDIVYIINFKYKSGPSPAPYALCGGDADCDCLVNILDVVYLINFKYKSGPEPCDCDTWVGTCGPPLR